MIAVATWIAVLVLGVGSAAVFVWFVLDFVRDTRRKIEHADEAAPD